LVDVVNEASPQNQYWAVMERVTESLKKNLKPLGLKKWRALDRFYIHRKRGGASVCWVDVGNPVVLSSHEDAPDNDIMMELARRIEKDVAPIGGAVKVVLRPKGIPT